MSDKKYMESKFNYFTCHNNHVICYNGLTSQMLVLRKGEYYKIFKDLILREEFHQEFPKLWEKMLEFLIKNNENEIDAIKFRNKLVIFHDSKYILTINPTLDCNLNCWYCDINSSGDHKGKKMDVDLIKRIKKLVSNLIEYEKIAGIHLDWFGGEPLLYFKEVVLPIAYFTKEHADNNKIPFSSHITTNGTLLNEELILLCRDVGINSFQITLDGSEEKHNKVRKLVNESSFLKIIENINLICKLMENSRITVRINYDKNTLKDITSLTDYFSDITKEKIVVDFQRVWQIDRVDENENESLKEAICYFESKGFNVVSYGFKVGKPFSCFADKYSHFLINYDGLIYKCTSQGYNDANTIGYISNDGQIKINNTNLYNMWFAEGSFENEQCLSCKYLPLCLGPCSQKKVDIKNGILNFDNACLKKTSEINIDTFLLNEARKRKLVNLITQKASENAFFIFIL